MKINIDLEKELDCEVEIYDITGRKVKSLTFKNLKHGSNEFNIDLNNFQSGLYFIKLKGLNFELHHPLEVQN